MEVETVNVCLKAAFGRDAPVASLDEGIITVGDTEIHKDGELHSVVVGVPISRNTDEGYDAIEVFVSRSFESAVVALVGEIAESRALRAIRQIEDNQRYQEHKAELQHYGNFENPER